jgi:NitT/TauT family transport system substrate-binding protein
VRKFAVLCLILVLLAGCVPVTATPAPGTATSAAGSTPAATAAAPAAATIPATAGGQLTKINLAMAYIPSVQFAPFYVAQERGYFKDAGLDVSFDYGTESDLLKLVGTNQIQFTIASGDQVILARSQGLPVRYVMRWYRQFPVALFALANSGIKTPKDVEGKRVGISMFSGASYVGWEALVYAAGIDASKVNVEAIGFTQAAAVSQGKVDAAVDYLVNGPVQLRLAGQQVTVIPVSNYIDLPSNGIMTNDQTIRDHPELVQALVTAVMRGLKDTLADPNAAFQITLKAVPEAGGAQTATNRAIFDESLKLWQAPTASLGVSDPAAWQKAAEFMQKMGLIQTPVNTADLFTNQFVQGQ